MRHATPRRHRIRSESLENRCLLSGAGDFASVANGVLTIRGDDLDNLIRVTFQQTDEPSEPGVEGNYIVECDGQSLTFAHDQVSEIDLDAGGGSDTVEFFAPLINNELATIAGGAGHDTITGAEGRDSIQGGPGDDSLSGSSDRDRIEGGEGDDSINGGSNVDELFGGPGADTLFGSSGPDDLSGGDGDDLLDGGSSVDTLQGEGGDDQLLAHGGDDTLDGGLGTDLIDGGSGDDFVSYDNRTEDLDISLSDGVANDGAAGENDQILNVVHVSGGSGNDRIAGNSQTNNFSGGAGDDTLIGHGGTDSLDGREGADVLDGGSGPGNGGAGNDFVSYRVRTADLQISLDDGLANDGEAGENDNLLNIERVQAGAGNDMLIGNSRHNQFFAGSGDDTIIGHGGNDRLDGDFGVNSISGGTGDDDLFAGSTVFGNGGNDTLRGGGGLVDGGGGDDLIQAGIGSASYFGRGGNDTIMAADSDDGENMPPEGFTDNYSGGGGIDTITYLTDPFFSFILDGTNITLDGLANDGREGEFDNIDDTFEVFIGTILADWIDLTGLARSATVTAHQGNDTITGGAAADTLSGNDDDDLFRSGDGVADFVHGGSGVDSAEADEGLDLLPQVENIL